MSRARSFGKAFLWLISVAALGLIHAGEALAVCCKTTTGCSCTASLSCALGSTKVSSCSTSGGALTLNGSRISCVYGSAVGNVSADPGSAADNLPAIWTEDGLNVTCTKQDDNGNDLGLQSGTFDLSMQFTMKGGCVEDPNSGFGNNNCKFTDSNNTGKGPGKGSNSSSVSQARCQLAADTGQPYDQLVYAAFCGSGVTVKGTIKASVNSTPPQWVLDMCTDSSGNIISPCTPLLVLGGFETDRKGNVINCSTDFPDQSTQGGLPAGKVLNYVEYYGANTGCTGPRIDTSDAQRRTCHDHTFYNPNYLADGTATNPPCAPTKTATYIAGILATDKADILGAELYDNQWQPNSTLNLSCNNSGNIPTTIVNSGNFAASNFQFTAGSSIVAYVKGSPTPSSPATSVSVLLDSSGNPTGLKVNFNDCTSTNDGLDQVICQSNPPANAQTVDLTIVGQRPDGLGFIGDALGIKINNVSNCPAILP